MQENKKARIHLLISGRVQGVFFRANTKQKAQKLGLMGWVKNTPDGKVEAVAEGDQEAIQRLIEWAKQGPAVAEVEQVDIDWKDYKGKFDSFEIRY